MIDLTRTREGFLADIDAPDRSTDRFIDITSAHFATVECWVRLSSHRREDLFSLLALALSERFSALPKAALIRNLLMPLKHALGNAYKHGNGMDRSKTITVEMGLGRRGALIAITDEGQGFDVELTFRRFRNQEQYFVYGGGGFHHLDTTASLVTYENGGRTVLLCFDPSKQNVHDPASAPSASEHVLTQSSDISFQRVLDSEWVHAQLSKEIPEFRNGETTLESCRVYGARAQQDDDCPIRYVLKVAPSDHVATVTRILTARLHVSEEAATADFEAATRLNDTLGPKRLKKSSNRLRVPRPVARLKDEPRLVLYNFSPCMSLWQFLAYRASHDSLRQVAERSGELLAALHRSQTPFPTADDGDLEEHFQAVTARTEEYLRTLQPGGPDLSRDFRSSIDRIRTRSVIRPRPLAPIHGAFGWNCVQYGVDNRFYLYRLERCRRSHTGFDLGGFASDLLCFTLAERNKYQVARDEFISSYNSRAEDPIDHEELPFFIACALSERLQSALSDDAPRLLQALQAVS